MIIGVEKIAGNSANKTFAITIIATNSGPPYFENPLVPQINLIVPENYSYEFPLVLDDDGDKFLMEVDLGEASTFASWNG